MLCMDAATRDVLPSPSTTMEGTTSTKAITKCRALAQICTLERQPLKKQQQVPALQQFDDAVQEELESRSTMEASQVTEHEDRVRDLLAQATEHADLISEKYVEISNLNKITVTGDTIRNGVITAAKRKDEMLITAGCNTASTIEELNLTVANLQEELKTTQVKLEAVSRVHPAPKVTREQGIQNKTIDSLRNNSMKLEKDRKSCKNKARPYTICKRS